MYGFLYFIYFVFLIFCLLWFIYEKLSGIKVIWLVIIEVRFNRRFDFKFRVFVLILVGNVSSFRK